MGYFLTELPSFDKQLKPPTQSFDNLVTISDSGTGSLTIDEVKVQTLNEKGESLKNSSRSQRTMKVASPSGPSKTLREKMPPLSNC